MAPASPVRRRKPGGRCCRSRRRGYARPREWWGRADPQVRVPFAASALAVAVLATDAQAARAAEQVTLPDGRGIHLECRGHGSPTVILMSGFPNAGDVWSLLDPGVKGPPAMAGIARLTRVCTYDRPNTVLQTGEPGRTDPVPQPRTAADTVADLQALTRAAELRGPYVLVGHSLGGLFARLYASTYPRRVAGIVEIDATYELLRDLISPEFWPGVAAETSNVPPGFESYDLDGVLDQMVRAAAARPLSPFLPLVVLSHGIPAEIPGSPATRVPGRRDARARLDGLADRACQDPALRRARGRRAQRALHPERAAGARDRRRPARARDAAPATSALPLRRRRLPRQGEAGRGSEQQEGDRPAAGHRSPPRLGPAQPRLAARYLRAWPEPHAQGRVAVRVQARRGPDDPRGIPPRPHVPHPPRRPLGWGPCRRAAAHRLRARGDRP